MIRQTAVRVRAGFLLSISSDGLTGWGEATPLPVWSQTGGTDTSTALGQAVSAINSEGVRAVESEINSLADSPNARAALVGAWADLRARQAGLSLAEHLVREHSSQTAAAASQARSPRHTGQRDTHAPESNSGMSRVVAVNALIAAPEPDQVGQQAAEALQAGFGSVKIKVGAAATDLETARVQTARSALGPEPELRLDANGAWDHDTAVDMLRRVESCRIAFCEEPVSGVEAIAAVGRASGAAVAVDESIRTTGDAENALKLGVGTLIVKPQALGGPDRALQIADLARDAGAAVVVTSFADAAIGVAHALHVAAAVDALEAVNGAAGAATTRSRAHGLSTSGLINADIADPIPIEAGCMRIPETWGLGISPYPPKPTLERPDRSDMV